MTMQIVYYFNFCLTLTGKRKTTVEYSIRVFEIVVAGQTLGAVFRAYNLPNNMKTYSTGTSTANHIRSKWFGSSRSLFGDSTFVTGLTIALIFGLIPSKNLHKCTILCAFYDEFTLFSTSCSKL